MYNNNLGQTVGSWIWAGCWKTAYSGWENLMILLLDLDEHQLSTDGLMIRR
jgi:hypothetical protein